MTAERRTGEPEPTRRSGWEDVKEMSGNFLLILFGSWLIARLIAFGLDGWVATGAPSTPWLILQVIMSTSMIILGIDRWRSHFKSKKGRPKKRVGVRD